MTACSLCHIDVVVRSRRLDGVGLGGKRSEVQVAGGEPSLIFPFSSLEKKKDVFCPFCHLGNKGQQLVLGVELINT